MVSRTKLVGANRKNGQHVSVNPATAPNNRGLMPRRKLGTQQPSATARGKIAQIFTAPAKPNATPAQASRLGEARLSPANIAIAPSRQNSTRYGSSSTVWSEATASGNTASVPPAMSIVGL